MVMCFVSGCRHYSERDYCKFFRFPKKEEEYKQWVEKIRRLDREPSSHSVVCSCHFKDGERNNGPTIFQPHAKLLDFIAKGSNGTEAYFSKDSTYHAGVGMGKGNRPPFWLRH
ncbi:THAP domain-containing protein 3-like [Uloborus diversus]|uniref:THAP domain-containing protein 3-like n=1 Tax=Uloborus diversus TaxID=327109 RepID=UPI00240A52BD|nr:THAP domain-containing protein 3-like [Uloborus diversus]